MYHEPYGPRGAESEREDFWTDIPDGGDMLPGVLPYVPGTPGLTTDGTQPYCPQCPNADDPALAPGSDDADAWPGEDPEQT